MDLRVLFKTKILGGVYTRHLSEYKVLASEAPIKYHGGIALLFRDTLHHW